MIVFVHLLNDFSGSPRILRAAILAFTAQGEKVKLYVGSNGDGFLSQSGIATTCYWYKRTGNRFATLFTYFFSQAALFCKLLCDRSIDKDAVIYVNTLLPFGAALYGRLTGRKVVYHVHEISVTPAPLKSLLTTIAWMTSSLNIYVSDAHMQALPIAGVPTRRIHNTLDADFIFKASTSVYKHYNEGYFNVLMIASLRDYKGIPELLDVASRLLPNDDIRFQLVVNDDEPTIAKYILEKSIPKNLSISSKGLSIPSSWKTRLLCAAPILIFGRLVGAIIFGFLITNLATERSSLELKNSSTVEIK